MSALNGCGGKLCHALRRSAKKFNCVRYEVDDFGRTCTEQEILSYKVCGKICIKLSKSSSNQVDIPGRTCGGYSTSFELLVIMSKNDILEGDIISDGDIKYRIVGQICDSPMKFAIEQIELSNLQY